MPSVVIGKVKGDKGDSGISPIVKLQKNENILSISVTDAEGTKTETIDTNEAVQADWNTTDTALNSFIKNKPEIPSKVSQLKNDSGYLTDYTETDPTVPAWAKKATKPEYTATEVGALPSDTTHISGDVPITRKVNGKTLNTDITLSATDVGALPNTTSIPNSLSDFGVTATTDEVNVLDGITATTTELNYVDGVTSNIQTQLDAKASSTHNHDERYYTESEIDKKVSDINDSISAHTNNKVNPHGVTASQVGLGNVGNFKAVSTVADQGLTDTEKANARENIGAGTSSFSGSYSDLTNKPTIPTVGNGTVTITQNGITKGTFTMNQSGNTTVELTDNNDNTTYSEATTEQSGLMSASDKGKLDGIADGANKTILDSSLSSTSTNAVQNKVVNTALSGKVPTSRTVNGKALTSDITLTASDVGADASGSASSALTNAKTYTDTKIANLVGTAPETMDTLAEVAAAIEAHQDVTDALNAAIGNKVDKVSGKGLSTNDLTNTLKSNYDAAYTHSQSAHAPSGAQANVLETVKVNGTVLTPSSKAVNITVPTKVSQLTNDSGFKTTDNNTTYSLTKSGSTITLTGSDGSTTSVTDSDTKYTHPTGDGNSHVPANGTSNGGKYLKATTTAGTYEWGSLTKSDVTTALGYTPPTTNTTYGVASSSALGLVKSGTDITVDSSGNVSVNDDSHNHVISNVDGLQSALDGKAASSHTHTKSEISDFPTSMTPTAHNQASNTINAMTGYSKPTSTSAISTSDTLNSAIGKLEKALDSKGTSNLTIGTTSTTAAAGNHTHSSYVNQNAFSNVVVGSTTVAADSATDTLTLVAGSNVTITPDATNDKITIAATDTKYSHPTYTAKDSGLYKVTVDGTGHVSAATAVTKSDITALGIPGSDTNTHYASKNVVGSSTATSNTTSALTNGNVYLNSVENGAVTSTHKISGSGATKVTTDGNGNIVISSTDTNTNTTYSAGAGISLSGTTFSNSGVRSIATGGSNGTISVNTNGTTANVAVKGLGSAAYTASSAYATASHTHTAITTAEIDALFA